MPAKKSYRSYRIDKQKITMGQDKQIYTHSNENKLVKVTDKELLDHYSLEIERIELVELCKRINPGPLKAAVEFLIDFTIDPARSMNFIVMRATRRLLTNPSSEEMENYRLLAMTLADQSKEAKLLGRTMLITGLILIVGAVLFPLAGGSFAVTFLLAMAIGMIGVLLVALGAAGSSMQAYFNQTLFNKMDELHKMDPRIELGNDPHIKLGTDPHTELDNTDMGIKKS